MKRPEWNGRTALYALRGGALLLLFAFFAPTACSAGSGIGDAAPVSVAEAKSAAKEKRGPREPKESDMRARSPYAQDASQYVLTFSEEFDRFDKSLWNDHVWYEEPNPVINYQVEHGMLKIWPQR